jgi:hypothetical protein
MNVDVELLHDVLVFNLKFRSLELRFTFIHVFCEIKLKFSFEICISNLVSIDLTNFELFNSKK